MTAAKVLDYEYTIEDYDALPEGARTELIRGQFYDLASPSRRHQEYVVQLIQHIKNYIDKNKGNCKAYVAPFDVHIETPTDGKHDKDTVVQPDISVIYDRDKLSSRGCEGAPDWIIEIVSPGTASHDYNDKLNLYAKNGVHEYWIVDPAKERILVYDFRPESEDYLSIYSINDSVKVNIYDDLVIDFSTISAE